MAQRTLQDYSETLRLIYPEDRFISVREVISWAKDLMCDNAIETERIRNFTETGHTMLTDEQVNAIVAMIDTPTLEDAKEWLSDCGAATFGRM
jgi:hypothetical protein